MLRRKIGEFYITEHIGSGGMSNVYLGLNPRSREKRAIKVLPKRATSSPATYARFQREIEIIRGLSHPNIVKILGSGVLDDCYFYMMDYMAGGSLSRRLARGRLHLGDAVPLICTVCDAMSHAHECGVVHRDLKPANILLNESSVPMVSDFGIAKTLDTDGTSLTRSSEIMGTIAYLAPEQRLSSKRVERSADVYGLGAILYEMLMGFPPLGRFPLPRELRPDFPATLQAVIEKCLSQRPEERFSDAGSLLCELEKCRVSSNMDGLPGPSMRVFLTSESDEAQDNHRSSDRIEGWFQKLRNGTTRERLAVIRDMVNNLDPREAKAILKLFPGEEEKVRWGLIRVMGELRIPGATPLIVNELKNPYHRECAIEALGNIGVEEGFDPIRQYITDNPKSAMIALLPLARTGKQKAVKYLKGYLSSEMAIVRQSAIQALAEAECAEALRLLVDHVVTERDERVRCLLQESIVALQHRSEMNTTVRIT